MCAPAPSRDYRRPRTIAHKQAGKMVMMAATRRRAWAPPEAAVEDAEDNEDEEDDEEEPCGEDEVPDFEAKVESLERELAAALKQVERAKKGYKRKSAKRKGVDDEALDEKQIRSAKVAHAKRLRFSVKLICDELNCRDDIAAEILNNVLIKCAQPVRAALRLMGSMQQEHFLGARQALEVYKQRCLNVANSLDLRSNEALPYSTMRRVSERLSTELIDGKLCRVVLMEAPSHTGEDNPLTRRSNREQGIWEGMRVRAPHVFQGDKAVSAALSALCEDHELQLSVPSEDGMDWAGWYLIDIARDVLGQAKADNNLRPLTPGLTRRLQMIFDAHGWTSACGATRFMLRCPDTATQHNSTRYARDVSFYVGRDKHDQLEKAVNLGGARSLWNTLMAGVRISSVDAEKLPTADALEAARDVTHDAVGFGDRMRRLLGIRWATCPIPISCPIPIELEIQLELLLLCCGLIFHHSNGHIAHLTCEGVALEKFIYSLHFPHFSQG